MKYIKQLLCFVLLIWAVTPALAEGEKEELNISHIVMEHIKDSYEWHITDIGQKSIVIHLPVIVHSSTGWHVFCSSSFAEEPDANGYRMGPANLAIATQGEHEGKVVEITAEGEKRPFDISITKTVATMFISVIVLLLCILLPATKPLVGLPDLLSCW